MDTLILNQLVRKRIITLEGLYNVRELGMLPIASEQQRISKGLLFRSESLGRMTDNDRSVLNSLCIKTIVDFREDKGRTDDPDKKIDTVEHIVALPIDCAPLVDEDKIRAGDGRGAMLGFYQGMVTEARSQFREFFRIISDRDKLPLLFHCGAGKDRTGLAAALILAALGVSEEVIVADYMLTVECLSKKPDYIKYLENDPNQKPVIHIVPEYLGHAFETANQQFGSLEKYLCNELNANILKLREIFCS
jgi:protein-tyrosine phosphatase